MEGGIKMKSPEEQMSAIRQLISQQEAELDKSSLFSLIVFKDALIAMISTNQVVYGPTIQELLDEMMRKYNDYVELIVAHIEGLNK
jgi:hypothetical protein